MTIQPPEQPSIEDRLTLALESQASSIKVTPDEAQIHNLADPMDRQAPTPRPAISKRVFVLVDSASLILAAIGFGMISLRSEDQTAATEAAAGPNLLCNSLLVDPVTGEPVNFVIWIDPDTGPESITRISDLLDNDIRFSDSRYISQEEVLREFREYYADQPTVLELVNPEEVPTYFQVTFRPAQDPVDPEARAAQIEADFAALEGVFKIQFPGDGSGESDEPDDS